MYKSQAWPKQKLVAVFLHHAMFDLKWWFYFLPNNLGSGSSVGKLYGSWEPLWKPTSNCSFTSAITVLAQVLCKYKEQGVK